MQRRHTIECIGSIRRGASGCRASARFITRAFVPPCLLTCGALVFSGCNSGSRFVLDSDIPAPSGMEARISRDLERENGRLVGGEFVYVGSVRGGDPKFQRVASRFEDAGWTRVDELETSARTRALFTKNAREIDVILDVNELDPSMSRLIYRVRRRSGDAVPATSPGSADDPTSGYEIAPA